MGRLAPRYIMLVLVLAAISGSIVWFTRGHASGDIRPHPAAPPAATGATADADQQGMPTTYAQALAKLNVELAAARAQATARPGEWLVLAGVGDTLLARARLTNSFEDYAEAGRWYDRACTTDPRVGPFLQRATWNFAVHRLAAVSPDLDRVDAYVVPDRGDQATSVGLRGDLDFYRGRYADALVRYNTAHDMMVTVGNAFRLANYWARMGDAAKALAYIDEAESRVGGPQQQLRAFLEMHRGIIAYQAGRWGEAGRHYARAAAIFPGHWLTEERIATVLALKGDTVRAMRLYRAIADRTGMPEAYDAVAGLYRAQGDLAQSQAWAAKAGALWARRLALLPEAAYGHALDHELAFGSDPKRALAIAQRNFANRPYAESATGLASAYMLNRRPADAIRMLRPVLDSGWSAAEPWIVATEAYALTGATAEADAARKRALEINPHSFDRNPGLVWLEH